ncbi:MAG: hypothetical protein ACE361_24905 [Aureliella sp.]
MLEIFALPYIGVTGLIGWAIFAPFFRFHASQPLTRAKLAIGDLLALSFQVSIVLSVAGWITPVSELSLTKKLLVVLAAFLYAAASLTAGLFLLPRALAVSFLQRMAVIGVIAPFGILLTVGWVVFLTWACMQSVMYFAPAMIAIAAVTQALRMLTLWVCPTEPNTA